jgi:protein phosphatase 1G
MKKDFFSGENPIIKYGVCSMQGWRRTMEDAHLISLNQGLNNKTHIFGIFDGHGGREVANYVKNHFTEFFLSNENYKKGKIKEAIKETFLLLDRNLETKEAMIELTKDHINFCKEFNIQTNENEINERKNYIENIAYSIGCTANIFIIYNNEDFYFVNSGDSRSLLLKRGESIKMSIDHKPELPNEFSRIKKAGLTINEGRVNGMLNLSRSIGDFQFKLRKDLKQEEQGVTCNPDILYGKKCDGDDFVVIGCDGVWECISNEGISDFIYDKFRNDRNVDLGQIIGEVFDRGIAKSGYEENGCDNMTCMIIQFKK